MEKFCSQELYYSIKIVVKQKGNKWSLKLSLKGLPVNCYHKIDCINIILALLCIWYKKYKIEESCRT